MRVIHTSDWHLGQELHGFDRGIEHDVFLDWLTDQLITQDADALIVTGDVYDTVNPPIPAQQRLYQFVSKALTKSPRLQIVFIGGNHDSAARLELPKHLLHAHQVHLVGGMPRYDGRPTVERSLIPLRDKAGALRAVCAAIPYLRPGDLPTVANGESPIHTLYRDVIVTATAIYGALPLVVTGHLHMRGGAVSELSERRIVIGGQEAVASDIFPASVAYVALGHLHKPQSIAGQTIIRYAGSPFPMAVTEKDYHHSIVVIDIDKTTGATTDLVRTPRAVAFHRVPAVGSAPLDVIEEALGSLEVDDPGEHRRPYLEVAVWLDGAEPELRRRIDGAIEGKPVRLTRIIRQTAGQGGALADAIDGGVTLDALHPAQVFVRRYIEQYGAEPPDNLNRAFNELLASVWSADDHRAGII